MQMREKVGKSRNTVFCQWFVVPEGRKVGSLKRRVRSQLARWEMKNCTPLWREAHFQVKMYEAHHCRTTFGSWDVEKVHAVVARSTFRSQHVKNTSASDHFWKLRCQKSARRCGAKHISKSTCYEHQGFGPLLEVQTSLRVASAGDCAPCQKWAKREGFVAFSTTTTATPHYSPIHYTTLQLQLQLHSTTLHCTTLHCTQLHLITLHCTTLHHITLTLHYTKLHSTTLNYSTVHYIARDYTPLRSTTLHYITLHDTTFHYATLHCITLHSTTLHYITLHDATFHYTSLHYTTLHSTTLNYTTLHYTTLCYATLHDRQLTLHYTPLHSTTLQLQTQLQLHSTTLHNTPQHSTTLHYTKLRCTTTLHYITLHSTTPLQWHCTTDRQVDR